MWMKKRMEVVKMNNQKDILKKNKKARRIKKKSIMRHC